MPKCINLNNKIKALIVVDVKNASIKMKSNKIKH